MQDLEKQKKTWAPTTSQGEPSFCFSQGWRRKKRSKTQLEMLLLYLTASFSCLTVVSLRQHEELRAERGFDGNSGGWFNAVAKWIWLVVCSLSLHTSQYAREGCVPFFNETLQIKKTGRVQILQHHVTDIVRSDWMLKLQFWVSVLVLFKFCS